MEHQPLGRHGGGQGHVELAARGDVDVHALLVHELGHRLAQERLGGVGDPVTEALHRLSTPSPEVRLVVDEQRRAVLLGQFEHGDAADGEATVARYLGVVGQELPRKGSHIGRGGWAVTSGGGWVITSGGVGGRSHREGWVGDHIDSGAETPRRSRPTAKPILAASSHRRAWVRSGSMPSPIT